MGVDYVAERTRKLLWRPNSRAKRMHSPWSQWERLAQDWAMLPGADTALCQALH